MYILPTVVKTCKLEKVKHKKSGLVQLATGTKRKVVDLVKDYSVSINGMDTQVDLNILWLRYYDIIIGMDWLQKHEVIFKF